MYALNQNNTQDKRSQGIDFEAPREQPSAEQGSASPNTQILHDYDSFVREEVPRLFLNEVEEKIAPSALQNFDIESTFRACLERAARAFHERAHQNQKLEAPEESSGVVSIVPVSEPRIMSNPGLDFLDSVLQPPPPQPESRILDPLFKDNILVMQVELYPNRSSDSGYASGKFCNCITLCTCQSNSMVSRYPTQTEQSTLARLTADNMYETSVISTTEVPVSRSMEVIDFDNIPVQHQRQSNPWSIQQPDSSQGDIDSSLLRADGIPAPHLQQERHLLYPTQNSSQDHATARLGFLPPPLASENNSLVPLSTQTNVPTQNSSWLDEIEWNYNPLPKSQDNLADAGQWDPDCPYEPFSARP